jgi:hypothetical protein
MLRPPLLLFLVVAACSSGPEADLASIGEARSLGAEWALVNEQALEGHLTGAYVETMRRSLREQLQSTARSLNRPDSDYGREIAALAHEPEDASPAALSAHATRLGQIEANLESA